LDAFWVRGGCRLEGEDLTRKYVDIGAGPEWEIWNGMRLGEHSGRSRVTGDISMLVVLGGREPDFWQFKEPHQRSRDVTSFAFQVPTTIHFDIYLQHQHVYFAITQYRAQLKYVLSQAFHW
jgi:hypothetical protein